MSVRGQGGPDREKAYYTEEVPREPGLPLRQHPPGLHQAGRHSFKVNRQSPPLTVRRKSKKAGRDHSTPPNAHSLREKAARGGPLARSHEMAVREPSLTARLDPLFLILGAILTHENTPRRGTPLKAGPRTGGIHVREPGNAAAAQNRAPLKIALERSRSTTRIARRARAHEPSREGHVTRHVSRPSPGSEGGGPKRPPHTVGTAKRATGNDEAPGAPHRNPHEPQRGVRGGFHRAQAG